MNNEIIFKRCWQANKTPVNKHFFYNSFGSHYSVFERFSFSLPHCLFLLYYLHFFLICFSVNKISQVHGRSKTGALDPGSMFCPSSSTPWDKAVIRYSNVKDTVFYVTLAEFGHGTRCFRDRQTRQKH